MNLPKMKNTLIALLFFASFNLNAQIPDSLQVELPWEVVRLNDCEKTMGEGPRTENENVAIQVLSDVTENGGLGLCSSRTKTWGIYDELGDIEYTYVQLGSPAVGNPLICQEDLIITSDQLPYILNIDQVVLNPNDDHLYSFDYNDLNRTEVIIETEDEANYDFYMYNHTLLKVCKLNVYISDCEDDIILNFPESAEIEFNMEPYIELTPEMLGVEIDYPCGTFTTDVRVGNSNKNILPSSAVGKVVPVTVKANFDDGNEYLKIIQVTVSGVKPDPISMFIEDKNFSAGETLSFEVWSEDIPGLVTWGLQMKFIDAEVLEVQSSEVFTNVPHNIYPSGSEVRALWVPADALPIDLESNSTWFTLVITPNIDGSTIDIFDTELDPWSEIVVEDDNYTFTFPAEFIFNVAPRDILDIEDEYDDLNVRIYPNPASGLLTIEGLDNQGQAASVELFDLQGKLVLKENLNANNEKLTLNISDLPAGMFVLKAQSGKISYTTKISKF